MIRTQFLLSPAPSFALKVKKMPLPIGLLFAGLVVGAILGAVVLVTVLYLAWKLGKVADAYSQKLTTKQ